MHLIYDQVSVISEGFRLISCQPHQVPSGDEVYDCIAALITDTLTHSEAHSVPQCKSHSVQQWARSYASRLRNLSRLSWLSDRYEVGFKLQKLLAFEGVT